MKREKLKNNNIFVHYKLGCNSGRKNKYLIKKKNDCPGTT